jgi:predicted RND superfamily exporter protein
MEYFVQRYTAWLHRNCLWVCALSVLVAIAGSVYTVKLYKNLRTDIEELLPENAQSVKDLKAAKGRVTVLNHLEVVIQSNDADAAKRFQIDLARELRKIPPTIAGKVKEGVREEREFFERNQSLYIDLKDWQEIYRYVKGKVAHTAFDLGLGDEGDDDTFDIKQLEKKYAEKTSAFSKFRDDLFQSEDGKTRFIIVFLPGEGTDIEANMALSEAATAAIGRLHKASYAPDLQVGLGGDVQNMVEEHHGLVNDLVSSFVIVTVLVTLVLLVFFRSLSGVVGLSFALFVGVALTFGVSYFAVGYLNANTAFLGSIVIGNGINFGVILLGRYYEERRHGSASLEAMTAAIGGTVHATGVAALAAGMAYGSLIITSFRGFNQFGVIGFLGMVLCWATAYFSLPAFLFAWERWRPGAAHGSSSGSFPLMSIVARIVESRYKAITYLSMVATAVAVVGLAKLSNHSIESDLTKLRNKESLLHGSGFWGKKVDEIFGRTLTPTVVLTRSPADTKKVYRKLQEIHAEEGAHSPFSEMRVVEDLLPDHQGRKLALMERLRKLLTPKVRAQLSPEEKKWVSALLPEPPPRPVRAVDLPPDLLGPFREASGEIGHIIHVYPRLNTADESKGEASSGTWDGEEVIRYTALLRRAIQEAGVPAVIAGQPPVSADMLSSISHDGPKATLCAFLLVMLLVVVMFPNVKHSSAIVASLLFGVLLMLGTMGFMAWKINFLNFIALPITFGIGVDYAVNMFGRYREEARRGTRSMGRVIRSTGGAVVLASLTTIIGYGSLLLSGSQAFVSFGRIAVLGEFSCIFAAVVCMPAVWLTLKRAPR